MNLKPRQAFCVVCKKVGQYAYSFDELLGNRSALPEEMTQVDGFEKKDGQLVMSGKNAKYAHREKCAAAYKQFGGSTQ